MEKVISLFVNKDRSFLTQIDKNDSEFTLKYINSAENHLDFENISNDNPLDFKEIENILDNLQNDFTQIDVIYPSEDSLISQIPYTKDLKPEEIAEMLELETRRTFPDLQPEDFLYDFYLINENKLMSVITQKKKIEIIENFLVKYGKPVSHHFNEQFCAANAFIHNYKEIDGKDAVLVSLQNNQIYVILISAGKIVYFKSLYFSNPNDIITKLETEIDKILNGGLTNLDGGLYLYGPELTKTMLDEVQEVLSSKELQCRRLNPFRILISDLTERELQYTSRAMQYFPACIGAVLPDEITNSTE